MASPLTMHRYSKRVGSAAIFTLAWQFLTNNSSPDILVDSHHCLNRNQCHNCCKVTRHVRGRGNMLAHACKIKIRKFLLKACPSFIQKFAPSKTSRYMVLRDPQVLTRQLKTFRVTNTFLLSLYFTYLRR